MRMLVSYEDVGLAYAPSENNSVTCVRIMRREYFERILRMSDETADNQTDSQRTHWLW